MVRRPALGLLAPVLAGSAFAVSLLLVAGGAVCGGQSTDAVMEGRPQAPARCVPLVHPALPAVALAAFLSLAAVREGRRELPLGLGLGVLVVSAPLVFSLGPLVAPLGLLMVGSGLAARAPAAPPRPWVPSRLLRLPEGLALAGLGFAAMPLVALAQWGAHPMWAWFMLAPALGAATSALALARRALPALALASLAAAWAVARVPGVAVLGVPGNALGDALVVVFPVAAALALAREGRRPAA